MRTSTADEAERGEGDGVRGICVNSWLTIEGGTIAEILYKELSFAIVGAAMEVHRCLGPGFYEAVYQRALAPELTLRGIPFEVEKRLAVRYKDQLVGEYQADLIVDGKIVVEIKAVSGFNPAHEAQALHYLAATGLRLALLMNFGAEKLQTKRMVR